MMGHETRDSFTSSELVAPPHTLTPEPVAAHLGVRPDVGLTGAQVNRRQATYGPNRLPDAPPRSAWLVLFGQFKSLLILILIGAAFLAALIGNVKDAVIIVAVVVINAVVGFYQEYRAEQSLAVLKGMLPVNTRVRREGGTQQIAAEDLVPGDVVLLEAGDRVPADGRLSLAAGLEIDESTLTGESQPVAKHPAALAIPDGPLGDRINMAYMNTMLTRGRAELIVTATGVHTETGRLSQELASAAEAPTPLQMQLDRLGKRLGAIALTLVGLLAFLELLRGTDLVPILLDAIALAVAAMPEGLPVVVTVTLALGMHRMARQRAIVKRLASVETLGCTTVICSDKTGTLTLNQMTVRAFFYQGERFEVSGEGYQPQGSIRPARDGSSLPELAPLLIPLVACNDSCVDDGRVIGDPMEAALLILADKGGLVRHQVARRLPRLAEVPFDAAHKFMATFHREDDHVHVFVKGAPDVLLARCDRWRAGGGDRALDADMRDRTDTAYAALAGGGLRGLLIASRTVPARAFDGSAAPLA
jgi:Ca2+-transporting ATPase